MNIMIIRGRMSTFGGPSDTGVAPEEGLALFDRPDDLSLFLPTQPMGTAGLARRLNPASLYVACRWDYEVLPREWLRSIVVVVTSAKTGRQCAARPCDWGPAPFTGRVADLSPGVARTLMLRTDDECVVAVPVPTNGRHHA